MALHRCRPRRLRRRRGVRAARSPSRDDDSGEDRHAGRDGADGDDHDEREYEHEHEHDERGRPRRRRRVGEIKASGHLALFGDPGTRVLGMAPRKGAVRSTTSPSSPGRSRGAILFDPTGESSGTHVKVKAGEHVKLRADFTGATASVKVTGRF